MMHYQEKDTHLGCTGSDERSHLHINLFEDSPCACTLIEISGVDTYKLHRPTSLTLKSSFVVRSW